MRTESLDEPARALWEARLTTPEEAVSCVASGTHVFVGTACATPRTLIRALESPDRYLAHVQLIHFLTDGAIQDDGDRARTRFRHKVFFVGTDTRTAIRQGKAEYVPIALGQVPRMIENGRIPVDVALVQVSPPDKQGFVSLGVSVDITRTAVEHAGRVIAEVNPNMPRTRGDTLIHLSRIDRLVEVDVPVIEYLHEPANEVAARIARYVAHIIEDGATLQIGLGRIPNEMLRHLSGRKDLGIHSDVITEPIVDLVEQGVITGKAKTLHNERVVASYCMGTRRLYDLVDDSPQFLFFPTEYVCNPSVIASNDRMVSVSQAFAIDLTGQVCADQFEGELYSGVSTQPDFLRGAASSRGGKAIVCLASTTEDGEASRIRPLLREGEGVTLPRSDVHFVVTEYGSAYLFGKSIRERALALIEIAHPAHRPWLLEEAKRLGYVARERALKSSVAYPIDEARTVRLCDGSTVLLRPSRSSDVEGLQDLFYSLTEADNHARFFTYLKSLSVSKAQYLCNVNYADQMAFVAVAGDKEGERIVGNACYYVDPSENAAEVAYLVHPSWQGLGLGAALQQRLVEYARSRGLKRIKAEVLSDNQKMLQLIARSGCTVSTRNCARTKEITMLL